MSAAAPGTSYDRFVSIFGQALGEVCSQAFTSAWTVAVDANNEPSSPETPLVSFEAVLSGGLQGNFAMQFRGPDALLMAQKVLSEPLDPSAAPKRDHKEALERFLRQVATLVVTALTGTFGEIKFDIRSGAPPSWEGVTVTLLASEASVGSLPLRLRLSSDLCASLSALPAAAPPAQTGTEGKGSAVVANQPNFDLLLGVNLNLTMRFGHCLMSLHEVLDMNSGSVIELDREVHNPADLLLGDKLIARGEVVIVDGNYGIRITEVADVQQRLETI